MKVNKLNLKILSLCLLASSATGFASDTTEEENARAVATLEARSEESANDTQQLAHPLLDQDLNSGDIELVGGDPNALHLDSGDPELVEGDPNTLQLNNNGPNRWFAPETELKLRKTGRTGCDLVGQAVKKLVETSVPGGLCVTTLAAAGASTINPEATTTTGGLLRNLGIAIFGDGSHLGYLEQNQAQDLAINNGVSAVKAVPEDVLADAPLAAPQADVPLADAPLATPPQAPLLAAKVTGFAARAFVEKYAPYGKGITTATGFLAKMFDPNADTLTEVIINRFSTPSTPAVPAPVNSGATIEESKEVKDTQTATEPTADGVDSAENKEGQKEETRDNKGSTAS